MLAYTSPALGHLYPIVPILLELRGRGSTTALRTLASQARPMCALGIEAKPLAAEIESIELDDFGGRTLLGRGRRALAAFADRAPHDARDLRRAIAEERPDALLVDCLAWGACAVAEASGLPWAQYLPFPLPQPDPALPAFGPGLRPARGPLGRLRDRALRSPAVLASDWGNLERLNSVRASACAPALRTLTDLYTRAPVVLHLILEQLEYPRAKPPPGVHRVGPCVWDPPAGPPPWLGDIERRLVLVATSSERQEDTALVRTALAAFAGRDFEVVATLPATGAEGLRVPENAHVERFLAHGPLLARAVCAITHGGAGVTQKALMAGVPVCVVPFGRDQTEIARRIELASLGTRLSPRRLSPARLRARVLQAIEMQPAAAALAAALRQPAPAVRAADAFTALLSSS